MNQEILQMLEQIQCKTNYDSNKKLSNEQLEDFKKFVLEKELKQQQDSNNNE